MPEYEGSRAVQVSGRKSTDGQPPVRLHISIIPSRFGNPGSRRILGIGKILDREIIFSSEALRGLVCDIRIFLIQAEAGKNIEHHGSTS